MIGARVRIRLDDHSWGAGIVTKRVTFMGDVWLTIRLDDGHTLTVLRDKVRA